MGTGAEGFSPFFIIDDRWIVRKPPHIGTGEYSDVERSVYLPQWFQHEFFHHLFRTYPSSASRPLLISGSTAARGRRISSGATRPTTTTKRSTSA
jgi:hypothetical protein